MTIIDEAVAALEAGEVVVLPTDTVYGLVARASDLEATGRLFALKGRADDVPLAVLSAGLDQALELVDPDIGPGVRAVAARWWPGPLTLVLPRRPGVELHLGEPEGTIGVRVPDHDLVRSVARRIGPLAATSANRHGEPVVGSAADAAAIFGDEVALVVDGGILEARSSTVVDATGWPWRSLRDGPIATGEILAAAERAHG